jgi:hypothetical protein
LELKFTVTAGVGNFLSLESFAWDHCRARYSIVCLERTERRSTKEVWTLGRVLTRAIVRSTKWCAVNL